MSASTRHLNRATLLLSIAIILGLVAILLPISEASLLSHESTAPVIVPQSAPSGTYFDHLVFIIMENAGISDICGSNLPPPCNGSNTPYMSSLANSYGIETQYVDLAGSSQPNYIGIMAATLNGCTSGCGPNSLTEVNLVDRFEGSGVIWKAYMENQTPTAGCDNSDHGFYEFIHNPFVSFHDIDTNATRCNKIVLANPANNSTCTGTDCALINDLNSGSAPNFMWLTPNDCNNMHGNSACSNKCTTSYTSVCNKAGDNYLSGLVPNILNSNTFQTTRAALFITFDEGSGFCPSPNPSGADCMYTVWAGPTTKTSFSSNHADTHYFFTKTIETNWGLATMTSNDAGATAMTEFFTAPSPDFSISASSPAPINAGQSASSTITVTALNGFSGTVSLTDTIQSGLGCGPISPNNISGSGTATVSCSATNAGNYTLTITGTSGSLIHTATSLYQFRDFTVAASSITVNAGVSGTSTITISAINRFAGTVTLTDAIPSGLVCGSITPGSVTGSGSAAVSCNAAIPGNYTLTITGSSGSLVHTAIPIFHVQDFGIAASSPAPVSVGSSVISTISISSINHFAGVVSLTDTVPSGLTCGTITPSSITGSGPATVSCSATIAGNYTLTLTGTSGSLVHTAVALFQYRDFTISASSPGPANAGSSAIATITVNSVNQFGGTVNLTDTVPSGLTCGSITPSSVTGSGTATISCTSTIAGNYTLTVIGTSGSLVHSTTALFQFRGFTMTATSLVSGNVGASSISTLTVSALNHFSGSVLFSDTVPAGLTCGGISPSSVTGSGTATVSCSASLAGNYTLTLTGTSGQLVHSTTTLFQFWDFSSSASSPAPLDAGSSATSAITITSVNHFNGIVSLTDTASSGLVCGAITPTSITGSGTATVSCNASIAANYTLIITGTSGSLVHTTTVLFQFQDFTTIATTVTVNVNNSGTSIVTIAAVNKFAGVVTLSDSIPTGIVCGSITPGTVTGSGTATISCTASVAGNYTLTITGTSGSLVHTATSIFQVQDFGIVASTPAPVNAGSSAASTITVSAINHFAGVVNLTDTVPSGLACGSISPGSVTGSGTASVSCSASVAGNYTLTITGSSGSLSHSATVVLRFQDFTMTATSPAAVNAGQSSSSTVTVAAVNGFAGTVNFSITPPPGLTCGSFSPASIAASGSTTVSCTATVAGNYTATITATSTPLIHNATIIFQFRDFTITATSSAPVNAGSSASSTITLAAVNHFAGSISLTNTVPSGLTCSTITPSSITGSGTSIVSCNASAAGNYTLTITGTSSSLVHNTTAIFQFQNFTISASLPAPVNAGSSATSTITLGAVNGFSGTVALSDAAQSGLTCGTIAPNSVTGSGTATVSCNATVAGNYTLTLTGTNGSLAHSATTLFQFQDFNITAAIPTPVKSGVSATSTITVTGLNHFSGTVSLTDTVPNGLTCSAITPSSVTGSGTATVSCSSTSAATYTLTITASSGTLSHSTTATFTITDFTITATSPAAVAVGNSATSTITVTAVNGFTGTVSLTDTVPANLTCGAISPTSVINSGTATVSCSSTVAGNYTLAITGTSTSLVHGATATFILQDFTISATSPAAVNAGVSATSTITVTALNHFSGVVAMTDSADSGLTCGGITPNSVAGSGAATVSCSASLAGNYTLTITGTSTPLVHTATAMFVFHDFTISANQPAAVMVGVSATSSIIVTSLNHFVGVVSLTDTVPTGLTCGAIAPTSVTGSGIATVSCSAVVAGNYTLTIAGTSTPLVHAATAVFEFGDFTVSVSSPVSVEVGVSVISTVSVTSLNHFAGTVSLTGSSPEGLACGALTPSSLTGSGTATMSCTATAAGTYTIVFRGTAGSLSHTTSSTIQAVDFSITGPVGSQVSPIGTNAYSSITLISLNGYSGNVSLTATVQSPSASFGGAGGGRPPLAMAAPLGQPDPSFNPVSIFLSSGGTGQSNLTIVLSLSVPAGNYLITVTASDRTIVRYIQFTLMATDFSLSSPTTSLTMNAGSNSTETLSLQSLNGFQGNLTLSSSFSPTGPLANLSPSIVYLTSSGNSSLLTILVPSNTSPGRYTLTVQATSGTLSHTIYITVTVQSGFTTTLSRILNSNSSASIAASAILALVSLFSIRSAQTIAKTKRRAPHSTMKWRRYSEKPRYSTARAYSITLGPFWTTARDFD